MNLEGKTILITGAARRVGRALALAVAQAGGDVIIHHSQSEMEARSLQLEIQGMGRYAAILQADFASTDETGALVERALAHHPMDALVNNSAIFDDLTWDSTDLVGWQRHLTINLTAPFLLSQAFAKALPPEKQGRIVNILDWRALRPAGDHFPYTISKVGLYGLTRSLAVALAPRITVNALALGAILPPAGGQASDRIIAPVPAQRWANLAEVCEALIFLLTGPSYITGEVIHIDGGRHLV
jgi:NAD(P)-dependent dehydrogenase (short-subunit alcohol dehydrogenase family)